MTQVFKGSALLDSRYGKIFALEGWHGKHRTGINLPVNPSLCFKVQWTCLPYNLQLSKERFIFGQCRVCLMHHVVYFLLLKVLDFLAWKLRSLLAFKARLELAECMVSTDSSLQCLENCSLERFTFRKKRQKREKVRAKPCFNRESFVSVCAVKSLSHFSALPGAENHSGKALQVATAFAQQIKAMETT